MDKSKKGKTYRHIDEKKEKTYSMTSAIKGEVINGQTKEEIEERRTDSETPRDYFRSSICDKSLNGHRLRAQFPRIK